MVIYLVRIKDNQRDLLLGKKKTNKVLQQRVMKESPESVDEMNTLEEMIVDSSFSLFLVIQQLCDVLSDDIRLEIFRKQEINQAEFRKIKDRFVAKIKNKSDISMGAFANKLFFNNQLRQRRSNGSRESEVAPSDISMKIKKKSKMVSDIVRAFKMNIREDDYETRGKHKLNKRYLRANAKVYSRQNNSWMRSFVANSTNESSRGNKNEPSLREVERFIALQKRVYYQQARTFFISYTATVEVIRQNKLELVHFRIPFYCKFISENIKNDIIWKTNRESDQERLESFLSKINSYKMEMKTRQKLSGNRFLFFLVQEWNVVYRVLSFIVFFINMILLMGLQHRYTETGDNESMYVPEDTENMSLISTGDLRAGWMSIAYQGLNWAHLILSIFVLIFSIIDRFPVSLFLSQHKSKPIKNQIKKKYLKFNTIDPVSNLAMNLSSSPVKFKDQNQTLLETRFYSISCVLNDFENIYMILYVVLSGLAFVYPLFYTLLLFDIVKRSNELQSVIQSITINAGLLLKTSLLGIYVMFFFAVVGYSYFPGDFKHVSLSFSRFLCFFLFLQFFPIFDLFF